MDRTVAEILDYLERPENEGKIQHLAHLKNLEHIDAIRNKGGIGGVIARLVLRFTDGHMDAFIALAECKNSADIKAFKQTRFFERIQNVTVGDGWENLEQLKELDKLKELENQFGDGDKL
ncbi:MAG: hypothetical protein FWE33_06060 [Defluviitaleaceae bacterium]|nr:hypothetical protein [Defluviitaleaceae bacterium]